jgi:hypothetical protein
MMRAASVSLVGSEFNDFLFASIGQERNGMLLSVLSALARLDVDPWEEAAELARLPAQTSTLRLASLIAALPGEPSADLDPGTIAARLVALLPRPASSDSPARQTLFGFAAMTSSRPAAYAIFCVVFVVIALGTQYLVASHLSPTPRGTAQAAASSTTLSQIPPPNFGQ